MIGVSVPANRAEAKTRTKHLLRNKVRIIF